MVSKKHISIREYARRRGCSDTAVHRAIKAGHITDSALKKDKNGRNRGIYPDQADLDWAQSYNPKNAKNAKLAKTLLEKADADNARYAPAAPSTKSGSGGPASKAKAQQVEAVFKAKLRELEYKEKTKALINRDQVYKELFAVGQELRSAMQSIPDRYIDEIVAADSRNAAHNILQTAIDEELKRISELKNIKL